MWRDERSDCVQTLLELLCYEMIGGRLSPEMEQVFHTHLAECPACMTEAREFMETLSEPGFCACQTLSRFKH